jgi:hypothetical protein
MKSVRDGLAVARKRSRYTPIFRLNAADQRSDWTVKLLNSKSRYAPKDLAEYAANFRYFSLAMAKRTVIGNMFTVSLATALAVSIARGVAPASKRFRFTR